MFLGRVGILGTAFCTNIGVFAGDLYLGVFSRFACPVFGYEGGFPVFPFSPGFLCFFSFLGFQGLPGFVPSAVLVCYTMFTKMLGV